MLLKNTVTKEKIKFIVWLVLSLFVTLFIWSNSIKDAEVSLGESGKIVEIVEPVLEPIIKAEGEELHNTVSFIVRKTAHFLEFCALGFVVSGFVYGFYKLYGKRSVFFPLFYTLAVAVTDEYIQSFSDRTSSVKDVLLDFAGSLFGITVFCVLLFCVKKLFVKGKKN